jgi:hypothetical protein
MGTLAAQLAGVRQGPVATMGRTGAVVSPSKGVSLTDLLAMGVGEDFIAANMAVGKKLADIPALWEAHCQRRSREIEAAAVKANPAPRPAAVPFVPRPAFVVPTSGVDADLVAQYEAMKAENERLKAAKRDEAAKRGVSMKVSEKGAVSVYGLGRFPVTLYLEQWERLLNESGKIKAFLLANVDKLATKE